MNTLIGIRKWFIVTLVIWILLGISWKAFAGEITEAQAIKTIMGEARGEPYKGQVAVAEVLRRHGNTIGFYGYTARFKASKREIETARKAWMESAKSNYSNGANHFEGDCFKRPRWSEEMKVVAHIGKQTFFKEVV